MIRERIGRDAIYRTEENAVCYKIIGSKLSQAFVRKRTEGDLTAPRIIGNVSG